jgi:hypothetical protein
MSALKMNFILYNKSKCSRIYHFIENRLIPKLTGYQNNQSGNMYTYKRNIQARLRNHCRFGKAQIITYSKCVSATLVIRHTKRMRRIMSSVACPVLQYFLTLFHKRLDFLKSNWQ